MCPSEIKLTPDQVRARNFAVDRLRAGDALTTIGGLAGTGKTTLVAEIVRVLRQRPCRIAFACYTGRAKDVLRIKLDASGVRGPRDYCGTLHGLLYRPEFEYRKSYNQRLKMEVVEKIVHFSDAESASEEEESGDYDYVIVDEASMLDSKVYADLMDLGVPVLAIGDHGQMPPVFGNFNLMADPMVRLEKIHRQAEKDPIIRLSMIAREEGNIPFGEYGPYCQKTNDGTLVEKLLGCMHEYWMLICGTNAKRCRLNGFARHKKLGGNLPEPIKGERVICLLNNHKRGICNGMMGIVLDLKVSDEHWYGAEIDMGEFVYAGKIFRWQFGRKETCKKTVEEAPDIHPDDFGDLFDYGYCLTAHKAQGCEADNVVVFEEKRMRYMLEKMHGEEGWRRWLYTSITRAKKQLIIVGE